MKDQFDELYKKTANEASDLLRAFGDIMQEQEEFVKENANLQTETFRLVWSCALMIEKYHYTVFSKDANAITSFKSDDMEKWKSTYYPKLVQSKIIHDTDFFDPQERNRNIGVGMDGAFQRMEYINFRYQLYAYLYQAYMRNNEIKNMLLSGHLNACMNNAITLIEPYIKKFNPSAPKELFTFTSKDMQIWKEHYFPILVDSGLLNDYTIFDPIALRRNYGIGDDGVAFCWEFQYFVTEAYRYMLLPLYVQFTYPLP